MADVVHRERVGRRLARPASSRSSGRSSARHARAHLARRVAQHIGAARDRAARSPSQQMSASSVRDAAGARVRAHDQVAARHVDLVGELERDACVQAARARATRSNVRIARTCVVTPDGQHDDLVADGDRCRLRRGRDSRAAARRSGRDTYCTGKRNAASARVLRTSAVSRICEQRRAVVPRRDARRARRPCRLRAPTSERSARRRCRARRAKARKSADDARERRPRGSRRGPSC